MRSLLSRFILLMILGSGIPMAETTGVEIEPINPEATGFEKAGSASGITWRTAPVSETEANTITSVDSTTDNLWRMRRFGAQRSPVDGKLIANLESIGVLESKIGTGGTEDCPTVATTVTFSQAGNYTLFLRYGTGRGNATERYDIAYSVNGADFEVISLDYDEATESDAVDGSVYIFLAGFEIWEKNIGTFNVEAGGKITVTVDDIIQDGPAGDDRSVYAGLRVTGTGLDAGAPPKVSGLEIDVVNRETTGLEKNGTDGKGNTWTTKPVGVADEETITTVDSTTDNLWRVRRFGTSETPVNKRFLTQMVDIGVLESKIGTAGTEDCPPVATTVTFAETGTYTVHLRYGTGRGSADERYDIQYSRDGQNYKIILLNYDEATEGDALDGSTYITLAGFEIWERNIGTFTVEAGGSITIYVDDIVQDGPGNDRSVYAGLRITGGNLGGEAKKDTVGFEVVPLASSTSFLRDGGDGKGTTWRTFAAADEFEEPVNADDPYDFLWYGQGDTIEAGPLGINTRLSVLWLIESGGLLREDCSAVTSEITLAEAGLYDVYLRFGNALDPTNRYDIQYRLNGGNWAVLRLEYEEGQTKAVDGSFHQHYYGATRKYEIWEKRIGTVEVAAGGTITIDIDDVEQDGPNENDRTVYGGIRVIRSEGASVNHWDLF
jgi:hypothetical protein